MALHVITSRFPSIEGQSKIWLPVAGDAPDPTCIMVP
jgi:hypothetical protein